MALRLSTGTRNGLCGTLGIKELFNGGKINLYSGSQPATADTAESGSLLCTITLASGAVATAGLTFGTAATGSVPKSAGVWSGLVLASGVAGWFRLYGTAGTTGASSTEVRVDGNVGVSGSDMVLANSSLVAGATVTVDTFTLTQPAS